MSEKARSGQPRALSELTGAEQAVFVACFLSVWALAALAAYFAGVRGGELFLIGLALNLVSTPLVSRYIRSRAPWYGRLSSPAELVSSQPVPLGCAIADALTRSRLRRGLLRSLTLAAIGAALIAWFADYQNSLYDSDRTLRTNGARTVGTVVSAQPDSRYSEGQIGVRYDAGGDTRVATVDLGSDVGKYRKGEQVNVLYDPSHPARMTITGVENDDPTTYTVMVVVALVGIGLLVVFGFVGLRWTRMWRIVGRSKWSSSRVVLTRGYLGRDNIVDQEADVIWATGLGQGNTLSPDIKQARDAASNAAQVDRAAFEQPVWLTTGRQSRVLAFDPAATHRLVLVHAPRSQRQARRWKNRSQFGSIS